jgi:DNA-directed RNA polymerase III subunit RPC3
MAFLTVKDTRENISKLAAASFIEPQEVPRSADRAPSRTFFLWFVDYPKVIQALLRHHYKALAAIQAQKDYQLGAKKALVEKRNKNRFDDSGLTVSDRFQLKELEKVLEALTVGEMRIDQDIFVLRDMDPTMVE